MNRSSSSCSVLAFRKSSLVRWQLCLLAACAGTLALSTNLRAATQTWTGGTSGAWGTSTNWNTTAGPVPATGDTALFNNAGNATTSSVTLSGATPVTSITFDTSSAAAYTIGTTAGSTLDLQSGGTVQTTSAVANIETVNAPISIGGNYTFSSNSSTAADVLDLGGTIGASASATLTLNGTNTGANMISGVISNDSSSLKTSIDKEGAGKWILSGANTFTGTVTIGGGTLELTTSVKAIGNGTSPVTLTNSGATLDAEVNGLNIGTLTGVVGSVITNNSGGAININLAQGGNSEFDGNFTNGTGVLSVTKSGGGNITLTGASTFTGGYTFADTATTFVAGASLATVTNATIITSLANSGGTSALGYGAIDIQTDGALIYDTSGTNAGATTATVTFGNSGGTNVEIDNDSASSTASLTLSSLTGAALNNTLTQNLYLGGTNTGTNTISSVLKNGSGAISDTGGNITTINKVSAGTWQLSGANLYGGGTNVQAGTLQLGSSSLTGSGPLGSGVGTVASGVLTGANFNGATVTSGAALDLNGQTISQAIVLNGSGISSAGALVNSSATAATISGGGVTGIQLAAAGSGYSSAPTLTFSGGGASTQATGTVTLGLTSASVSGGSGYTVGESLTITPSGGGSGVKATVGSINGSGGITSITLTAPGSGFTSSSTATIAATSGTGATFNTSNYTITGLTVLTAGSGYTSAPTVTVGSGAATVTAYTSGVILGSSSSIGGVGAISIAGPVSDGGSGYSLTKVGSNTLTLSGVDTYSGGNTVSAGMLTLGSTTALGSTSAALAVNSSGTLNLAGISETVGAVTLGTGGSTISNTGSAATLTTSGVTVSGSGNTIGSGVTVSNAVGFGSTAALADNGVLSGNVMLGSGTLTGTGSVGGTTSSTGGTINGTGLVLTGLTTFNGGGNTIQGTETVTGGITLASTSTLTESGAQTGGGVLTVNNGATLAGTGSIAGTSFNITGTGTTTTTLANILVGHASSADTNTTSSLTLKGSTGTSAITDANLTFNLNTGTAGQANELSVGTTNVSFSNTTLTLNMVGSTIITAYTPYILIAGTGGNGDGTLADSQYSGLSTSGTMNGNLVLTGLNLAFTGSQPPAWYVNSYLFLVNSGGVDDIEVEVVPEPSTWAMMLGGLGVLLFWQQRKNKRS